MKYDRDTMKSLQEAYESVNEDKFYSGKDRDPNTGLPKGLKPEKAKKVKTKKAKKPNYEGSTAGSDLKDIPEQQEHEGMKYSDKKKLERQEQLKKASKKAPTYKNKIVGFNKESYERRIKEAHEMSRKEYNRINKDFKGKIDKDGNAYVVVGQDTPTGNRETLRRQYKITDEVDKKKEMEDKMKEVEDMRSLPTRMNLIKTKLRAMGLNMSHQLKGKELSEVIDYTLVERTRYQKEMGIGKGGTAKNDLAFQAVMKKYGNQRMGANEPKKVKGAKSDEGTGKFLKMQNKKKQTANQTAADAEKRGFDNVQNYVDTMARYGGKKNYDSGRGLD